MEVLHVLCCLEIQNYDDELLAQVRITSNKHLTLKSNTFYYILYFVLQTGKQLIKLKISLIILFHIYILFRGAAIKPLKLLLQGLH